MSATKEVVFVDQQQDICDVQALVQAAARGA